jgi:hypothetical protein
MRIGAPLAAFLAVAAVGLAACSSDSTVVETGPIVGSWTVVEINGEPLPITENVTYQDMLCSLTLTEFNITFRSNRTYVGDDDVTRACLDGPTDNIGSQFNGTWRTSGSILFMAEGSGPEFAVLFEVDESTLTITGEDEDGQPIVQILQRQ